MGYVSNKGAGGPKLNFTTKMQEVKLHDNRSCTFCFFSIPRVRVIRISIDKGLPCAIAL